MTNQNIKKLVTAALLAAMTCVATMIIKIPTPTFGYIHPGDGFVLLCGVVLGPLPGSARCRHRLDVLRHFLRLRDLGSCNFHYQGAHGAALPDCSSIVLKTPCTRKRDATQRSQSAASSEKPSWSSAIFSTKPDLPHSAAEP